MKEKQLIEKLILLAGEALYLAEEYSGGESETAHELTKQLEKLIKQADKLKTK